MQKKRIDAPVVKKYKKNSTIETALYEMNSCLKENEFQKYVDLGERFPTVHIIGVPRSGSTLLTQLISNCIDVGYINNLIASFWDAPVYGIRLSQHLLCKHNETDYRSEFGRTNNITDPHEFGYFWFSILKYKTMEQKDKIHEETIDWGRLQLVLKNITYAFNKPTMFKNFLISWHIEKMYKTLPKTCYIWIRRSPLENALSLLNLREKYLGSRRIWASMKPNEYKWLSEMGTEEQVAGQVFYIEKNIKMQLKKIPNKNKLVVTYEELCENPNKILEAVRSIIERNGPKVSKINEPPDNFKIINRVEYSNVIRKKIDSAINKFKENSQDDGK